MGVYTQLFRIFDSSIPSLFEGHSLLFKEFGGTWFYPQHSLLEEVQQHCKLPEQASHVTGWEVLTELMAVD